MRESALLHVGVHACVLCLRARMCVCVFRGCMCVYMRVCCVYVYIYIYVMDRDGWSGKST